MLKAGDILDERYRIIGLLGQGAWGCVYLAENINLGNRWAIKEIDLSKDTRVNLLAEPHILKKLNHPSLPRIIDILRADQRVYIIEDFFEGTNLKEIIKSREYCNEARVVKWAKQLCEILIYLHHLSPPIIYRDMKPGNIIIDNEDNVKLVDFGIAREYKTGRDSDSTFIGTRGYAAPEQFCAGQQSDERTDIYGMGVTLYHALSGVSPSEPPYQMMPLREINPAISKGLERIVHKCVQTDPDMRYQSVEEIVADLQNIGEGSFGISRFFKNTSRCYSSEKTVVVEKPVGTMVVAIGGTSRGVGSTYTAISIATFLAGKRLAVAVNELNDNPVFFTLLEEGARRGRVEGSFRHGNIDFCGKDTSFTEVLQAGYDYVVLDLGQLVSSDEKGILKKSQWFEEMNRADEAILVAGSAIWQLKDLAPFIKEQCTDSWKLLFRTPNTQMLTELKKELGYQIFASAFNPEPFKVTDEQYRLYTEMLKRILPKEKRWSGLAFWR